MEIKTAQPRDAREIAEINVETWKIAYKGLLPENCLAKRVVDDERVERISTSIGKNYEIWLKAVDGDKIIGYLLGGQARDKYDGFEYEIYAIYVRAEYWRKGVGQALFKAFKEKINGKSFYLYMLRGNQQALSFYRKQGGKENEILDRKIADKNGVLIDEIFVGFDRSII